jgi:hypothetical protein
MPSSARPFFRVVRVGRHQRQASRSHRFLRNQDRTGVIEVVKSFGHLEHVVRDVQRPELISRAMDDGREFGDRLEQGKFLGLAWPKLSSSSFAPSSTSETATVFLDAAGPSVRVLNVGCGVPLE